MSSQIPILLLFVIITISLTLQSSNAQNSPTDYLEAHNSARAEVGVGPLRWNKTLANFAMSYAKKRTDCELIHSEGPYGENIYEGFGDGYENGVDGVRDWYSEKKLYDYNKNDCLGGQDCWHYTQMVWKDTTSVGCARIKCKGEGYFVTCNYYPPGNIWDERPF